MENYLPGRVNEDPDDPRNLIYIVNSSDKQFGIRWQQWKDAVELGADFYDGDRDGIYNPVDKNWNGIGGIGDGVDPYHEGQCTGRLEIDDKGQKQCQSYPTAESGDGPD